MERSSSTLVNVAEHAELRLVRLLSNNNSDFESTCETCIANADAVGLIRAILQCEAFDNLLSMEDATSAFSVLACLISRIPSKEDQTTITMELASAIVNSADAPWTTRMDMLCSLFNLRPNGSDKCQLLQQIITLAAKEQPSLLEPTTPHSNITPDTAGQNKANKSSSVAGNSALSETLQPPVLERLVESWGPSTKDQQDLFLLAAHSLAHYPSVRQSYLLKVLKTSNSLDIAKSAAVGAIKDPITLFTEQRNILSLPAIQALSTQPESRALYELLKIFQEDMLSDFEAFCEKYGTNKVAELLGGDESIVVEQCRTNMRMLSLCSLASEQYYQEGEIPYPAIVSSLRIQPGEVEPWVISAVSSGLLTAKMDQIQQVVLVERSVLRKFGPTQWAMLQNRLHAWKSNVGQVLQNLQQQQQIQSSETMIPSTTQ